MNNIECPRCLGKKHVDNSDIKRLNRENEWLPGPCAYCKETGTVDSSMLEEVTADKADLTHDMGIEELIAGLYEKTVSLIIAEKPDNEILDELEESGVPRSVCQKILDKAKGEIKKIKKSAHREVAGTYLLKGSGFLALGAIITGITYSMASGGGHYVITTGLFAVGGIYIVYGLFKFLLNL